MMDQDSFFNQERFVKSALLKSQVRESTEYSFVSSHSYLVEQDITGVNSSKCQSLTDMEQEMLTAFMKVITSPHQDIFNQLENYKEICREMIINLNDVLETYFSIPSRKVKVNHIMCLMTSELNTWMLVQALSRERMHFSLKNADSFQSYFDVKESEKEVAAHIFDECSTLRQAQVVIDWLEFLSKCQFEGDHSYVKFFSERGSCRENTLHLLLNKENKAYFYENLVTEMDPDGPIRQGKKLGNIDEDDEDKLLYYIFSCIKSGQLDEATKMCTKIGQPWRAASLQGWKLFHDPNIKCLGPGGMLQKTEGNHLRNLWRIACWQMAENDKLSTIERAVYASLSCNLKNLLPACKSWHEYLWAYARILVDNKVENHLRVFASNKSDYLLTADHDSKLRFEEIFCEIECSSNEVLKKECLYRFNVIQKFIILDQIEVLVEMMSKWCGEDTLKPHPILLRFMTHLLLFFKSCGASFPNQQETIIISSYVDWLVEVKQVELIATYASYLPIDLQVISYARFLEDVGEKENWSHCLELAEIAGLNTKAIVLAVVGNVCKKVQFLDKNIFHSLLSQDINEEDLKRIDAIEWLLMDNGWRLEAIQQSNDLFRMFISFKKIQACNMLMNIIPKNSVEIIMKRSTSESKQMPMDVKNSIREFMCVSAYLEAQESFSQWFNHFHAKIPVKPTASGSDRDLANMIIQDQLIKTYETNFENWKNSLSALADECILKIKEVLQFADGGWMVDECQEYSQNSRKQEMLLLRQLCLPFLFTLLQTVYISMERFAECGRLYDILVSEHYQLYKVFNKEELEKFSYELISSSIDSLNKQNDPLGHYIY